MHTKTKCMLYKGANPLEIPALGVVAVAGAVVEGPCELMELLARRSPQDWDDCPAPDKKACPSNLKRRESFREEIVEKGEN